MIRKSRRNKQRTIFDSTSGSGRSLIALILYSLILIQIACDKSDNSKDVPVDLEISYARVGNESILNNNEVSPKGDIIIGFSAVVETETEQSFGLYKGGQNIALNANWSTGQREITLIPTEDWKEGEMYTLILSDNIKSTDGGQFPGIELKFSIRTSPLGLNLVSINSVSMSDEALNTDIPLDPQIYIEFSGSLSGDLLKNNISLTDENGDYPLHVQTLSDSSFAISMKGDLEYYSGLTLRVDSEIGNEINKPFEGKSYDLFTTLDSSYKFPEITDQELLTLIQEQTFRYFWDFAHPNSGMARERNTSGDLVTTGGTGFGLMAIIVAVDRGFISRDEAVARWGKILNFLSAADRFHGAWPHWIDGNTGKVIPFSEKDNGGDLVETAFLVQGMLTVRQYLSPSVPSEKQLIDRINDLWQSVEWDWFTRSGEDVIYWHWSPDYKWEINLPVQGHNETHIVYILAAASPGHSIDKETYDEGYARVGDMVNGNSFYGKVLPLGNDKGGPLFFTHYSYLGLDPRNLSDQYADYWEQNVNHTLINRAYCMDNPVNYVGYSKDCWGLTASDGDEGYSAHSPNNDRGVITPTAAISSLPYTPEESMDAIRHFYYILGDRLWGDYGFYDAFNITEEWVADSYLAIDQGPIICMIENYRTGLLWDLFMSAPEIQDGLDKLGFN